MHDVMIDVDLNVVGDWLWEACQKVDMDSYETDISTG